VERVSQRLHHVGDVESVGVQSIVGTRDWRKRGHALPLGLCELLVPSQTTLPEHVSVGLGCTTEHIPIAVKLPAKESLRKLHRIGTSGATRFEMGPLEARKQVSD